MKKSIVLTVIVFTHLHLIYSQPISNFQQARAFEISNMPDSALFYYELDIKQNPTNIKAFLSSGNIYYEKKEIQKAIINFEQANKVETDIASLQLAKCYGKLRDTLKTISYLQKYLKSRYKESVSKIRMDPAFAFLEKAKIWNELWQNDWYSNAEEQEGEARFLLESGNWIAVINFVTETSKNGKIKSNLLLLRAEALIQMQNYQMALADLNIASKSQHKNADVYLKRGNVQKFLNKIKDAESDYSSVINIYPDAFDAYYKRSECRYLLKKNDEALEDIDLLIKLFPQNSDYQFLKCKILIQSEKYLNALVIANNIIKLNPNNPNYLLYRARIYQKSGMQANALSDYNTVIKLTPNNIEALRERGLLQYESDNTKAACSDWKKAEKLGDIASGKLVWENCK